MKILVNKRYECNPSSLLFVQLARACRRARRIMAGVICVCVLLLTAIPTVAAGNPQLVWFCLLGPDRLTDGRHGATDYANLFTPTAPWGSAASHVQVFKIYSGIFNGNLPGSLSDAQWQQVFADLDRRGIALALEWPPLSVTTCGKGVEGFEGKDTVATVQKIKRLGGDLKYVAMDEPEYYGDIYKGHDACSWTQTQIAANAVQNFAKIRTVFPHAIIGDIEPVPPPHASDWLERYTAFIDAWKVAAGSPLAFFHCDINWDVIPNWIGGVESLRHVLVDRGIPFGMIYNGLGRKSDADWMQAAEQHFNEYESKTGIIPDQVIFQSWEALPTHALPESDPTAFTYLIDAYFGKRSGSPGQVK